MKSNPFMICNTAASQAQGIPLACTPNLSLIGWAASLALLILLPGDWKILAVLPAGASLLASGLVAG